MGGLGTVVAAAEELAFLLDVEAFAAANATEQLDELHDDTEESEQEP